MFDVSCSLDVNQDRPVSTAAFTGAAASQGVMSGWDVPGKHHFRGLITDVMTKQLFFSS